MPHTKRNNYKSKWLSLQSQLNQSQLKTAGSKIATSARKLSDFGVSSTVLESTTLLLEKEYIDSIEMMAEYAKLTEITFDPILYSPGGGMGNKIKTASGVMAIMRERLGIIYEAFIDLSSTAEELKDTVDSLQKSADTAESIIRELEIKPGPGNLTARDPQNVAGLTIRGQRVKFHDLTPIDGVPQVRAELLPMGETPVSPRTALAGTGTRHANWPVQFAPRRRDESGLTQPRPPVAREEDSDEDDERVSDLETVQSSADPSPSRPGQSSADRPGNQRVLLRPERVRPIPLAKPRLGWRQSLPGSSDIDWKELRKIVPREETPLVRTLNNAELYDIMIGKKKTRRNPALAEVLRSLL